MVCVCFSSKICSQKALDTSEHISFNSSLSNVCDQLPSYEVARPESNDKCMNHRDIFNRHMLRNCWMATDNTTSSGEQHIYPVDFQDTLSRALLNYIAACDLTCLLSDHLEYTKLVFRVDAAAHLSSWRQDMRWERKRNSRR